MQIFDDWVAASGGRRYRRQTAPAAGGVLRKVDIRGRWSRSCDVVVLMRLVDLFVRYYRSSAVLKLCTVSYWVRLFLPDKLSRQSVRSILYYLYYIIEDIILFM